MVLVVFWNAMVTAIRVLFFSLLVVFLVISAMCFALIFWKAAKSPESDEGRKNF